MGAWVRRGCSSASGKTTWTPQATLTGREESGKGEFGCSVAMASKEANYALIGGPGDNGGIGAAWVFTRVRDHLDPPGEKLTGAGENGAASGRERGALRHGRIRAHGRGQGQRRSRRGMGLFRESGKTTGAQQGEKLTGKEEAGDGEVKPGKGAFGFSVALSRRQHRADRRPRRQPRRRRGVGVHALGRDVDPAGESSPARRAKSRPGRVRRERGAVGRRQHRADRRPGRQRKASARRGCSRARARPGPSRAKSSPAAARPATASSAPAWRCPSDGNTALIGGPADNGDVGAAWVFTRSGATWTQQGEKLTGGGESGAGAFGTSVALSSDGNTALIGGRGDNSRRRRGVGVHALGRDLDPAGRKAHRRRRDGRGRIRLTAWRCPPTATPR